MLGEGEGVFDDPLKFSALDVAVGRGPGRGSSVGGGGSRRSAETGARSGNSVGRPDEIQIITLGKS